MPDLSPCGQEAHTHDRDRFLSALFVPPPEREALLAALALNIELARVREKVSEEMIAQLRFAWWQEALADIYAGKPARGQPVLEALAPFAAHLPKESLAPLVESYREHFPEPPPDADALLEAISTALLRSLCPKSEAGWRKAQGIINKHRRRYGKGWNGWLGCKLLWLAKP